MKSFFSTIGLLTLVMTSGPLHLAVAQKAQEPALLSVPEEMHAIARAIEVFVEEPGAVTCADFRVLGPTNVAATFVKSEDMVVEVRLVSGDIAHIKVPRLGSPSRLPMRNDWWTEHLQEAVGRLPFLPVRLVYLDLDKENESCPPDPFSIAPHLMVSTAVETFLLLEPRSRRPFYDDKMPKLTIAEQQHLLREAAARVGEGFGRHSKHSEVMYEIGRVQTEDGLNLCVTFRRRTNYYRVEFGQGLLPTLFCFGAPRTSEAFTYRWKLLERFEQIPFSLHSIIHDIAQQPRAELSLQ